MIEDTNTISTTMDGKPYKAGHFVAQLRRQLWREHLGLLPHQKIDASNDPNAKLPGDGDNVLYEDEHSKLVDDPLSDDLWDTWQARAHENTGIFRELFHCIPDNEVKTFQEYDDFLPKEKVKTGHLYNLDTPVEEVKKKLDGVRGHLVEFPMCFLEEEKMAERGLELNEVGLSGHVFSLPFHIGF